MREWESIVTVGFATAKHVIMLSLFDYSMQWYKETPRLTSPWIPY